ncbi:YeeE/YedE family protein [Roseovarius sp. SYSU LYC5161]|uniref:YeeE/YedE family protein n=1 Tax=Roseovarius halophilus (ex Wu et al. 2025) TaxID=3376060 RepID=UPI003999F977
MIETEFTPLQSLAGGALIGGAAVLVMATLGRIMGATGILSGVVWPAGPGERRWRASLLLGMISGPLAVYAISGEMPEIRVQNSTGMFALGGVLVGIGVTFGSGCTSGHGVCGMARVSPRSIVATVTFMITTAATVFVVRHIVGG